MRILVVEDEEAIARGLRFNFEREGYQVDLAASGPAALELYESAQPPVDLVVLDLMLPEMSGYEICRALRWHSPHALSQKTKFRHSIAVSIST
jgi:two-component system OmpR family response regulator